MACQARRAAESALRERHVRNFIVNYNLRNSLGARWSRPDWVLAEKWVSAATFGDESSIISCHYSTPHTRYQLTVLPCGAEGEPGRRVPCFRGIFSFDDRLSAYFTGVRPFVTEFYPRRRDFPRPVSLRSYTTSAISDHPLGYVRTSRVD